jgi:hypothetical protein
MSFTPVPVSLIQAWQQGLQAFGTSVEYFEAPSTVGRMLRARVRFAGAIPLANSIAIDAMRLTFDARDFPVRVPQKGDTVIVDGVKRGVMQAAPVHVGETLVGWSTEMDG